MYGHSGTGKTFWWTQLAEDIFVRTGKRTRLYIGDGGVQTVVNQGLVEDGIVEVFNYLDWDYPLRTVQLMTEGYWPVDPQTPNSKLVAPTPAHMTDIGLWVFEGLTVVSEYIMGSTKGGLAARAAEGEKIGQDSPVNVVDPPQEGEKAGLRYGGNAMAHWNFAQRRLIDAIQRSKSLSSHVIWTAHERASEDRDNGNEKIIGPDAAGKALTPKIPLWFGHTIHMTTATKKVKVKDPTTGKDVDNYVIERRAYTRDHADPDGTVFVRYLANTRVPIAKNEKGEFVNPMPEFISPPDAVRFYKLLEDAKNARRVARGLAKAA